jgi:hypothetical protein
MPTLSAGNFFRHCPGCATRRVQKTEDGSVTGGFAAARITVLCPQNPLLRGGASLFVMTMDSIQAFSELLTAE